MKVMLGGFLLMRRWLKGTLLGLRQHLRLWQCPGPKTDKLKRMPGVPADPRRRRQDERRRVKSNIYSPLRKFNTGKNLLFSSFGRFCRCKPLHWLLIFTLKDVQKSRWMMRFLQFSKTSQCANKKKEKKSTSFSIITAHIQINIIHCFPIKKNCSYHKAIRGEHVLNLCSCVKMLL